MFGSINASRISNAGGVIIFSRADLGDTDATFGAVLKLTGGKLVDEPIATYKGDIYTVADLEAIGIDGTSMTFDYTLKRDIRLTKTYNASVIRDSKRDAGPAVEFKGTFDGEGHTISNLKIDTTTDTTAGVNYVGLFEHIEGGTVKNLIIEMGKVADRTSSGGVTMSDAIKATVSTNDNGVGALVGRVENNSGASRVENVKVDWKNHGADLKQQGAVYVNIGGLIGLMGDATITSTHAVTVQDIDVVNFKLGEQTQNGIKPFAGGLIGMMSRHDLTIQNVRVKADITFKNVLGISRAGGIIGRTNLINHVIMIQDISFYGDMEDKGTGTGYSNYTVVGYMDGFNGQVQFNRIFINYTGLAIKMPNEFASIILRTGSAVYSNQSPVPVAGGRNSSTHTNMNALPAGFNATLWTANGESIEVRGSSY